MEESYKDPKHHVHFGHIGIIALTAFMLFAVVFMKNGFHVLANDNASNVVQVSYSDVKNKVDADVNRNFRTGTENSNAQLAMLDPTLNKGAVLGASTEDVVISDEALTKIKLKISNQAGSSAIKKYADNVLYVETANGATDLIMGLNSTDKNTLLSLPAQSKKLVGSLAQIEVPKELEQYHKFKMIYYITLGEIAKGFSEPSPTENLQVASQAMFSLLEKIDTIKASIFSKYEVEI